MSLYFNNKIFFNPRLAPLRPQQTLKAKKVMKKRKKKSRDKRKVKPGLKDLLKKVRDKELVNIIGDLLEIKKRSTPKESKKDKKPRSMKLAKGSGLGRTTKPLVSATQLKKRPTETQKEFEERKTLTKLGEKNPLLAFILLQQKKGLFEGVNTNKINSLTTKLEKEIDPVKREEIVSNILSFIQPELRETFKKETETGKKLKTKLTEEEKLEIFRRRKQIEREEKIKTAQELADIRTTAATARAETKRLEGEERTRKAKKVNLTEVSDFLEKNKTIIEDRGIELPEFYVRDGIRKIIDIKVKQPTPTLISQGDLEDNFFSINFWKRKPLEIYYQDEYDGLKRFVDKIKKTSDFQGKETFYKSRLYDYGEEQKRLAELDGRRFYAGLNDRGTYLELGFIDEKEIPERGIIDKDEELTAEDLEPPAEPEQETQQLLPETAKTPEDKPAEPKLPAKTNLPAAEPLKSEGERTQVGEGGFFIKIETPEQKAKREEDERLAQEFRRKRGIGQPPPEFISSDKEIDPITKERVIYQITTQGGKVIRKEELRREPTTQSIRLRAIKQQKEKENEGIKTKTEPEPEVEISETTKKILADLEKKQQQEIPSGNDPEQNQDINYNLAGLGTIFDVGGLS